MADLFKRVRPTSTGTWGWAFAILATFLNGLVVGYGSVALQFFGERADAEDYAVSSGGYSAAALVLMVAIPGLLARGKPKLLVWCAASLGVLLIVLALASFTAMTTAEQVHTPVDGPWDGVGGVIWAPWTWAIMGFSVQAVALRFWKSSAL